MTNEWLPQNPWKRNFLSLAILFNLIVVPLGSYIAEHHRHPGGLEGLLVNYVWGLRVHQYWALFSPEPRRFAIKYSAVITYRDGHSETWRRPYPPNWAFFERHLSYNFQKWDLVNAYLDHKSGLWDDLVAYLIKSHQDKNNPVEQVRFLISTAPWPPPNTSGYVGGDTASLNWSDAPIFTYDVQNGRYL